MYETTAQYCTRSINRGQCYPGLGSGIDRIPHGTCQRYLLVIPVPLIEPYLCRDLSVCSLTVSMGVFPWYIKSPETVFGTSPCYDVVAQSGSVLNQGLAVPPMVDS